MAGAALYSILCEFAGVDDVCISRTEPHRLAKEPHLDIGDDEVDPPSVSYEQRFLHAGNASPRLQHELIFTSTLREATSADRGWEDEN